MLGRAPTSKARAVLVMTLHMTVPVLVPVPVQPSLSEEEEEKEKKEDPYELRSGRGHSRPRGPGASVRSRGHGRVSGAICHDPVDDISVMEEEKESKRGRGVRKEDGVTSPRTLRQKRREEKERQKMELEAMREIPWCMYDDGDNTDSIEVHRPPDNSPHQCRSRKQLHAILVPHPTTKQPSSARVCEPDHHALWVPHHQQMWKDTRVVSALPAQGGSQRSLLLCKCYWMVVGPLQWQEVWLAPIRRVNRHPPPAPPLN